MKSSIGEFSGVFVLFKDTSLSRRSQPECRFVLLEKENGEKLKIYLWQDENNFGLMEEERQRFLFT